LEWKQIYIGGLQKWQSHMLAKTAGGACVIVGFGTGKIKLSQNAVKLVVTWMT
jgi:hypothetical protein